VTYNSVPCHSSSLSFNAILSLLLCFCFLTNKNWSKSRTHNQSDRDRKGTTIRRKERLFLHWKSK